VGTNSDAADHGSLLFLTNIVFPLGCPVGLVLFLTANAEKTGPTGSQGRTERSEGGRPERGAASAKWIFVWRAGGAFANGWKRLVLRAVRLNEVQWKKARECEPWPIYSLCSHLKWSAENYIRTDLTLLQLTQRSEGQFNVI